MRLRLSVILVMCFLVVSLGPMGLVASLAYRDARARLGKEITDQVRRIAADAARGLEERATEDVRHVAAWARSPALSTAMVRLEGAFKDRGLNAAGSERADAELRAELGARGDELGYRDVRLVTTDGRVVFSLARASDLGANLTAEPHRDTPLGRAFARALERGKSGISDSGSPEPGGRASIFVAAPMERAGTRIGVLVAERDVASVLAATGGPEGPGRTLEIVIGRRLGADAVLLSPTRGDPEAAPRRRYRLAESPDRALAKAVQGASGEGPARDYRDHDVWAVWRYLPTYDWGLVVKIDAQEAFAPLVEMREGALGIAVFGGLIAGLAALGMARWMSGPIVALEGSTRRLARGELGHRAGESGFGEVRELARAFNADFRGPENN